MDDNDVPPSGSVSPMAGSLRVLVVEDNADAGEALALLLESLGHRADAVGDGAQALAIVGTIRPDVALVDIGLPDISGHEVARGIRASPDGHEIVLVALTGFGSDEDRRDARAAGFDHHLVKPVEVDHIIALLATVTPRAAR